MTQPPSLNLDIKYAFCAKKVKLSRNVFILYTPLTLSIRQGNKQGSRGVMPAHSCLGCRAGNSRITVFVSVQAGISHTDISGKNAPALSSLAGVFQRGDRNPEDPSDQFIVNTFPSPDTKSLYAWILGASLNLQSVLRCNCNETMNQRF